MTHALSGAGGPGTNLTVAVLALLSFASAAT